MCLSAGCLQDDRCWVGELWSAEAQPGRGAGPAGRSLDDRLAKGAESTAKFRDRSRQKFGLRKAAGRDVFAGSDRPIFPRGPLEGQRFERLMPTGGQSAVRVTDSSISDRIEVSGPKRRCIHDKKRQMQNQQDIRWVWRSRPVG